MAPNEGAASVEADAKTAKSGFWSRIVQFVRQVIAELKKVVWPTRDELTTFFVVVIVFVLAMMAFSGVIDVLTAWVVSKVFGG
ncbi:preprotein translocase subunit SecE [Varibaculum vaginae]|uniref:preprotein translocase subunit SecE n=1 Tax=Varibaculum vaginae TaxID=2364797 RepID=UPI000F07D467|nr:preprotein translocase subunit SecE [Varibaculum vaginae]